MAKYVQCKECLAIGGISDMELVKDQCCKSCGGNLQRIAQDSFDRLLHHSCVPLMKGEFNPSYEKCREETTCVAFQGKALPDVRVLSDPHPCEGCKWHGTYEKDETKIIIIEGEQTRLTV